MTINGPKDVVNHYGLADEVIITEVKGSSHHENGTVPFLQIKKGRVVLEDSSKVTHIHIERKNESSFDEIVISKSTNVEMPELSRDPVTIGSASVLVVEVETDDSSQYVWLEGNGTIEDSKVLVSSTKDGEKTAVTESSADEYVKQVANTKVGDNVIEGGKTAEQIETIKNEAIDEYYETEFIPNDVPENAISYTYNHQTKELRTFTSLEDAFNSIEDGGTIIICKDVDLGDEVFSIVDKSVTISGQKDMKPVIRGDFFINHTAGNHMVTFRNLVLMKGSGNVADNIKDKSICNNENDANELTIENCIFDSDLSTDLSSKHYSAVAIYKASNNHTGTAFIFKNNEITARAAYQFALCTGVVDTNLNSLQKSGGGDGLHFPNVVQPIIEGNIIKGSSNKTYGFIGSSAYLKNNTFDGIKKAFQVYAVWSRSEYRGEFNFVVTGNKFKNIPNETFKFYNVDKVTGDDANSIVFEFADDNTFENVAKFAEIGSNSAKFGFEFGLSVHEFAGITDPSIHFSLASATLSQSGNLVTNYMTLPSGEQVMTYTQAVAPESGRTGLYYDINNTRLWYFADKTQCEHYFIDNDNKVYVVRLVPGESTTTANMQFTNESEPEDFSGKDGKIYNATFSIDTFNGNTLYNASASQLGNKVTITALDGKTAEDINLFISNIGENSKLLITSNASATADSDTLIYVIPNDTKQINTYGNWDVIIDADIYNYQTNNKQTISTNAGKSITGSLTITGTTAKESVLTNNGNIRKVNFNTKSSLVNNGTINSVNVVDLNTKTTVVVTEYVINAYESSIVNNGTINFVGSSAKITLTNNADAEIGGLWLTAAADNEEVYSRAVGSVIINNGTMAAMNNKNIEIKVRCTFTNNGVIGKEGRGVAGEHSEAGCTNYGGVIYIGDYSGGSLHDGLIFVNNGTIYAGARHNGNSHQQVTFWICGSKSKVVNITISNTGTISGSNWRTTFGYAASVTGITINNSMGN